MPPDFSIDLFSTPHGQGSVSWICPIVWLMDMPNSLAFDTMAPHVEWVLSVLDNLDLSIPACFSTIMVHLASVSLEMALWGLMKLTKSCLDFLVLDKYALMADTTQRRLSSEKDVRWTVDSESPVRFDFRNVFRSNVASSLSMLKPSRDNAIIVWPYVLWLIAIGLLL